ncbi:terminase large subunit [Bacillus sp. JAS24-2]|uniref:terminase large subunit n=1 Tax=Bacillus sp. JAS24-2 TaxID=2217832 RepID=UPI002105B098|nr:terminase large subunit [Bacillus sp. JAS24-2]
MSNKRIAKMIQDKGYEKEKITGDSNEPKSIDKIKSLDVRRIEGARKGKGSIKNGIQFIQGFKIVIHPSCVEFIKEIYNYIYATDKKKGKKLK